MKTQITLNEATERITDASAIMLSGIKANKEQITATVLSNEKIISSVFSFDMSFQAIEEIKSNVAFRNSRDLR